MKTTASINRQLPTEIECEDGLIAAALIDPRTLDSASRMVSGSDFSDPAKQELFDALVMLHEARFPIGDVILLWPELKKLGVSVTAAELVEIAKKGIAHHANHYAIEIRKASLLRKQIATAEEIIDRCHAVKADPGEIASWVDARFNSLNSRNSGGVRHVGDIAGDVLAEISKCEPRRGASWSLASLDSTFGKMADGRLIVLAALTGQGKTAFAGQIAIHNAQQGRRVLFASLEMTERELTQRWLCSEAGVDSRKVDAGELTTADLQVLGQAREEFKELPIHVYDTRRATAADIRAEARLHQRASGLDLMVVDYLSRIGPTIDELRLPIRERISRSCWAMVELAKELDVPLLLLHQLNRDANSKAPQISNLSESADVERDAGFIGLLHDNGNGNFSFIAGKNRYGAKGAVPIAFDAPATRFHDRGCGDF